MLKNTMTGPSTVTSIYKPMKLGMCTNDMSIKNSTLDGTDPLTQFAREELDSLSQMPAYEVKKYSNFIFFQIIITIIFIIVGIFIEFNSKEKGYEHERRIYRALVNSKRNDFK